MKKGAEFSEDRVYRYDLWRIWDESEPTAAFIGLNPSTADETVDDPTIRRCVGYARSWGYGGIHMLNIFAYRATDPKDMKKAADPVGPKNDSWLLVSTAASGVVIAAWGSHGKYRDREAEVIDLIPRVMCLKTNKGGEPAHPLYLKKDLVPIPFLKEARG